jgi:hypothetical protein
LQLTQALPPAASKAVAGAGGALLGQLGKLAPGSGLAGAPLFPTDKQGRALLYYKVDGEVSRPRFSLDAGRMAAEGPGNAVWGALEAAARQKQEELQALAPEEKARLEAAAKARLDAEARRLRDSAAAEKKRLEVKAAAERKNLEETAAEAAKKQGKKILEGLGR